ncbi:MAG: hypothetical protein GBAus27B_000409 [Mycoplasmataceae bacterium]|nr:MAG: hypothetical protein GBAus27B_000409 [Mycoplasmataceae bacterium]
MPHKDKKKPKELTAEEKYWEKVAEHSHYLIADTLNKNLPLPNLREKDNFNLAKDNDYSIILRSARDYYYEEQTEEILPDNPNSVAEKVAYEYLVVIIYSLTENLSTWTPYDPEHFANLTNH